jgi:hypothetical protein
MVWYVGITVWGECTASIFRTEVFYVVLALFYKTIAVITLKMAVQWLYIHVTGHVTCTIKIPSNSSWYRAHSSQLAVQKALRPAILCVNCSVGSFILFDNYLQPPAISSLAVPTQPTWLTAHTWHSSGTSDQWQLSDNNKDLMHVLLLPHGSHFTSLCRFFVYSTINKLILMTHSNTHSDMTHNSAHTVSWLRAVPMNCTDSHQSPYSVMTQLYP